MLKGAVCLLSTTRGDIYFANIFAWQWRLSWLTSLLLNRVPLFLEKRLFAIFKPRFCHFGKFGVSVTRLFIVIFAILKSFFSPLYCLKWFLWASQSKMSFFTARLLRTSDMLICLMNLKEGILYAIFTKLTSKCYSFMAYLQGWHRLYPE